LKKTPVSLFGCLALLLCSCNREKKTAAAADGPPAVGVGVAAAADATIRFELWLLTHQPDKTANPTVPPGKILADVLKGVELAPLIAHLGMPEWQARIQWSWDDMGPTEPELQRELARLDDKYTMNSYSACVWPGPGIVNRVGRACVMQSYACYAARNKLDDRALDIIAAAEMPNEAAVQSVRSAGANTVAEYLRTNKYCK